jgi:ribonucleoside-diphosphate reductase alpha chain
VTLAGGAKVPLDSVRLALIVNEACTALDGVDAAPVIAEIHRNI